MTTTTFYVNAGAPIGSSGNIFTLAPGNPNTISTYFMFNQAVNGSLSNQLIAPAGSLGDNVTIVAPVTFYISAQTQIDSSSAPAQATFTVDLQLFNTDATVKRTLGTNSVIVSVHDVNRHFVPVSLSISISPNTIFTIGDIIGFTLTVTNQNVATLIYSGSGGQTTMMVTTAPHPIDVPDIKPNNDGRDRIILIVVIVLVVVLVFIILLVVIVHSASHRGSRIVSSPR